jgi:hypothetical protein
MLTYWSNAALRFHSFDYAGSGRCSEPNDGGDTGLIRGWKDSKEGKAAELRPLHLNQH